LLVGVETSTIRHTSMADLANARMDLAAPPFAGTEKRAATRGSGRCSGCRTLARWISVEFGRVHPVWCRGESMRASLELRFDSAKALKADFEQNLRKGRAFLAGARGVEIRERCEVRLVHPESQATLCLPAEAVWVKPDEPGAGVGVQLLDVDAESLARLEAFVTGAGAEGSIAVDAATSRGSPAGPSAPVPERQTRNVHDRVRQASIPERDAMARHGTLPERIALERRYGGAVWEALLQNPQLTPPEVTRIAKNGGLPKPLVNIIVNNAAWVCKPEVQRALLSNPRVAGAQLDRVLRAMSKADLARVPQQSAYRAQIRMAAKQLLKR